MKKTKTYKGWLASNEVAPVMAAVNDALHGAFWATKKIANYHGWEVRKAKLTIILEVEDEKSS